MDLIGSKGISFIFIFKILKIKFDLWKCNIWNCRNFFFLTKACWLSIRFAHSVIIYSTLNYRTIFLYNLEKKKKGQRWPGQTMCSKLLIKGKWITKFTKIILSYPTFSCSVGSTKCISSSLQESSILITMATNFSFSIVF